MRIVIVSSLAILLLPFAGCDRAAVPGDRAYRVVDSAGTRFVWNNRDTPTDTWMFREDLRIGTAEGADPYLFTDVRGLLVSPVGQIYVLDNAASEVRVFGSDGRWQFSFGGAGSGPGEFRAINGMVWGPGQSIWVHDHGNNRISVFASDGALLATHPRVWEMGFGFIWAGAVTADTTVMELVRHYGLTAPPEPGVETNTAQLYLKRLHPDGTIDSSYVGSASSRFYRLQRGIIAIPFERPPQHLLHLDGVWGVGSHEYRLSRIGRDGDTTLVIEQAYDAPPITATARDSAIAAAQERMTQLGVSTLDWSVIPERRPSIRHFFVDDVQRPWVGVTTNDTSSRYHVFDSTGVRQATVLLDFIPVDRGDLVPVYQGGRLYAVVQDSLDVTYIIRALREQ